MRTVSAKALAIVACVSLIAGVSASVPASENDDASPASQLAGKAGLYVRIRPEARGRRGGAGGDERHGLYRANPLVDAVVLPVAWADLEPRRGEFNIGPLQATIRHWGQAGKGVVLGLALYGQFPGDGITPAWVYDQPNVRGLSFRGGGVARGREVRVPAVWDLGFVENFAEPLIAALAKALDGEEALWFVVPGFGHIGALTAQPSPGGSDALLRAGWTPQAWGDYCDRLADAYARHFRETPLLVVSSGMLLRDRAKNYYASEANQIFLELTQRGAAAVQFGLEADREQMQRILTNLSALEPAVRKGTVRTGLGDDWPLWVPPHRRDQGPTRGHDDAYLERSLNYALGGVEGLPKLPITILWCQEPEMLAADPQNREYQPAVERIMKAARERLLANERVLAEH